MELTIPKKYLKFFISNLKSRHLVIQGSRRSAKTWSVLQYLFLLASGSEREDILVVSPSYPSLQNTIQDFMQSTGMLVEGSQIYGFHCRLDNGSIFRFVSYDRKEKAQGTKCSYLFVDEALSVDEGIISTLSMSVSKQIFFAYNPTKKSFLDKYIDKDKKNFILTSYIDNEYLPEEQKEEFRLIKDRALSPTATTLDRYNYYVYVLGEFSSMAGKVFKEIWNMTDDEYDNIRATEIYGLDFGFVDNNDKTVLVGAKIFNNCLYLKEYIFSNTLSKDKDLAWALVDAGITPYDIIAADYGGMGKSRLTNLITASNGEWAENPINKGFNVCNAVKGRIIDGIQKMQQFDRIYVTENSINMREEFDRYELNEEGKEVSKHQNTIDAARYATTTMLAMGYK